MAAPRRAALPRASAAGPSSGSSWALQSAGSSHGGRSPVRPPLPRPPARLPLRQRSLLKGTPASATSMSSDEGGGSAHRLVFEYKPIPVTPMSVALLILFGIVTFVLGPLGSPPELWPIGGVCFLPFLLLLGFVVLNLPSATRIYHDR